MKSYKLSDGTPVEFVKTTSKGNTQVRLPDDHPFAEDDNLRIFHPDGTHYKDQTDLRLIVTETTNIRDLFAGAEITITIRL